MIDPRTTYLSPRELEVLTLIGRCFQTKEIADRMGVGLKVVGKHRERCCLVLNAHAPGELVYRAFQLGLVTVAQQPLTEFHRGKWKRFAVPALEGIRA